MPLNYIDTSALLKRYVEEVGSGRIDALLVDSAAVSSIARVEIASALARRTREGALSPEQREEIYAQFLDDLTALVVVVAGGVVLQRAATLALAAPPDAPLRTLGAIHLASALTAFEERADQTGGIGAFVTSDRQLRRAAEGAGLHVVDPEADPAAGPQTERST